MAGERQRALEAGNKTYFTGKPCPSGHIAERFVSNYGCAECLRERSLTQYYRDLERRRAVSREYAKRDPEGNRRRSRSWAEKNRDKVKITQNACKPRTKDRGDLSLDDWLAIKERQGHRCACCGTHENDRILGIDHILPISKGGTNDPANIQALCWPCNQKKGRKHIDYRGVA